MVCCLVVVDGGLVVVTDGAVCVAVSVVVSAVVVVSVVAVVEEVVDVVEEGEVEAVVPLFNDDDLLESSPQLENKPIIIIVINI